MNVNEAIRWAAGEFESAGVDNPERNAEILLEYVLGKKRFELCLHDGGISEECLSSFKICVEERAGHVPVAYITMETEFMSLPFFMSGKVFIPRPETEILVEAAMSKLKRGSKVIDICTGCGNIAVSLAKYCSSHICACDISPEAVELARENAMRNEVSDLISFCRGDMFAPFQSHAEYDLVISNPPYIRRDEMQNLPEDVCGFEPHIALDGGADGLRFYHIVSGESARFLKPGGYVMVEVGFNQAGAVSQIFMQHFKNVETINDYAGIERIVIAQN